MSTTAYRTTISLSPQIGKKLQSYKNKSALIEKSLKIFFERSQFLQKAEDQYWQQLEKKWTKSKKKSLDSLVGIMKNKNTIDNKEDYKKHLLDKYI